MKLLHCMIFLLTLVLSTTPSQGIPIGSTRGCNQSHLKLRERNMRKSLKTPWKIDKPEKFRSITKVNCDCPDLENLKPQNTANCPPAESDPEKWFVKVYNVPDTRPQKCILCTVSIDPEQLQPQQFPNKSIDIHGEFKRCTLQCDKDWLVLRCMPYTKICPRMSRKNCASVFCTKFLQINEPEKLKKSNFSAILQRK